MVRESIVDTIERLAFVEDDYVEIEPTALVIGAYYYYKKRGNGYQYIFRGIYDGFDKTNNLSNFKDVEVCFYGETFFKYNDYVKFLRRHLRIALNVSNVF